MFVFCLLLGVFIEYSENVYNAPHIGDEVDECSPLSKLEDSES